jgi:class 3 adenylate cyclase/tetratricopeptide (TPR) repeat protein
MFCDLVGSSALAQRLGPEDWHRVLNRIHTRCGEIIVHRHGHVAQYLGDGLLAYFGYPVAAEDAPRQAVAAGIELTREVALMGAETGTTLSMRIGIHTGTVVVGNVGARAHQESLALGTTPNVAARVQELASPGAVVLTSETRRLVEGYFEMGELGDFQLKGFTEPVQLHRAIKAKGPTSRLEAATAAGLTPLVGRRAESAVMEEAWEAAMAGAAPVIHLVGEPGIGKSRQIHALRTHLGERVPVMELRSSEHARTTAFSSILDCLQRHTGIWHGDRAGAIKDSIARQFAPLGLSGHHVATVASLLGVPIEPPIDLPASQHRGALLEALTSWIMGTEASDPRVVIAEDLHWADPSTLEVLSTVLERTAGRRLLMVFSSRPVFSAPWVSSRIKTLALGRLDANDARTVIARVAGERALPLEIVEPLVARAEGIPLFLEEMTRATIESGLLRQTSAGYVLEDSDADRMIPATLHDSLMGRLDQLGSSKPLVQLAAVLGREFSYSLFEAVWRRIPSAPSADLAKGLERVVRAQLLAQDDSSQGTYSFRHSLLQDAAYQSLLRSTQREYHLHTANALVEESPARAEAEPEVIAYHFSAARQSDKAVEYWSKAGDRSTAASAYAEAISHFGGALEHLARLPEQQTRLRRELDLRTRLGVALITTRGYTAKEVEENYTRASELCAELGDETPYRVLYGVWVVILIRGDLASTQRMVTFLERSLEQRNDAESAVIGNAMLGAWSFFRGDYPSAVRHNATAMKHYDLENPKEQHGALVLKHGFEGMLWPALFLSLCQAAKGDAEAARRSLREAGEIGQRIGDPYLTCGVLAFGALMNHELGEMSAAAEMSAKALELANEKGYVYWVAIATIILGSCKIAENPSSDSIGTIREGLNLLKTIGDRSIYIHYMSYLANAHVRCGQLDEAEAILQDALTLARTRIARFCEPELLRLLGEVRASRGDVNGARDLFLSALELSRSSGAHLYELRVAYSLARALGGGYQDSAAMLGRARSKFNGSDFALLSQVDGFLQPVA